MAKSVRTKLDRGYERFIDAYIGSRHPATAVPEAVRKFNPTATIGEIELITNLIVRGREAAQAINASVGTGLTPDFDAPLNPFRSTIGIPSGSLYYTTEVTFLDKLTGATGTWQVGFSSPFRLGGDEVNEIALELFSDRYSASPDFLPSGDDANDFQVSARTILVSQGGT